MHARFLGILVASWALPDLAAGQDGVAYTMERNEFVKYHFGQGTREVLYPGLATTWDIEVDPSESTAYVLDGELSAVDLATGSVQTLTPLDPLGLAIALELEVVPGQRDPSFVYVIEDRNLCRIDLLTGEKSVAHVLSQRYVAMELNADASSMYLFAIGGEIVQLDLVTGEESHLAHSNELVVLGGDMVLDDTETILYVAASGRGGDLLAVSVATGSTVTLPLPPVGSGALSGLSISRDGRELILSPDARSLWTLDLATEVWSPLVDVSVLFGRPIDTELGRSGNILYLAINGGVSGYDLRDGTLTRFDRTVTAEGFAVDPVQQMAYVVSHSGSIDRVNLATRELIHVTSVPGSAEAIALRSDRSRAVVLDGASAKVVDVDLFTGDQLPLADHAFSPFRSRELLLDADEDLAYVVCNFNLGPATKFAAIGLPGGPSTELVSGSFNVLDAALLAGGQEALLLTSQDPPLLRLNLSDGSTTSVPTGPLFGAAVAITADNATAIVAGAQTPWPLLAVDLSTGAVHELVASTLSTREICYFNTADGSNVSITLQDSTTGESSVSLAFDQISAPGDTTVVSSTTGFPTPTGFQLGDNEVFYDISTTASFTGQIEICIDYSESTFQDEASLQMFHYEDGAWQAVTTSLDTDLDLICGSVTSLSPFAVFELQPGLDAVGLLHLLVEDVHDVNLAHGISNSLDAKLDRAIDALVDANENNNGAAVNALHAFISAVEAQRGDLIPVDDANPLVATARVILNLL